MGFAKNTAKISVVVENSKIHESEVPKNAKPEPKKGKMWAALEAVQADLAAIREAMAHNKTSASVGQKKVIHGRGCAPCQEKGLGDQCDHCFVCGDPNHYACGCRNKSRAKQGNGRRLPQRRDRE